MTHSMLPRASSWSQPAGRSLGSSPDQESIFGNTYGGVPNPVVPHKHPYPTRYHGPVFVEPEAVFSFRARPLYKAPVSGVGGCCSSCDEGGPCDGASGLGIADGDRLTGSFAGDALLGVVTGYLSAPTDDDALLYAAAGGAAGAVFGIAGSLLVSALSVYKNQEASRLRWWTR